MGTDFEAKNQPKYNITLSHKSSPKAGNRTCFMNKIWNRRGVRLRRPFVRPFVIFTFSVLFSSSFRFHIIPSIFFLFSLILRLIFDLSFAFSIPPPGHVHCLTWTAGLPAAARPYIHCLRFLPIADTDHLVFYHIYLTHT